MNAPTLLVLFVFSAFACAFGFNLYWGLTKKKILSLVKGKFIVAKDTPGYFWMELGRNLILFGLFLFFAILFATGKMQAQW